MSLSAKMSVYPCSVCESQTLSKSYIINLPISVKVLFHQFCMQKFEGQSHVYCDKEDMYIVIKKKRGLVKHVEPREVSQKILTFNSGTEKSISLLIHFVRKPFEQMN